VECEQEISEKAERARFSVVNITYIYTRGCGRPNNSLYSSSDLFFNIWGRKFRNAEERLKVFIDDFYIVREDIVLGPFPTILAGRDLEERDLERRDLRAILQSWISQAQRK
jgi:hypothetical protein